ncbi:MAG: outer membrane protein assembly factor BamE [Deltaproteobacteria bacterium]|jgi:outer membrane protein assembly factor BamE (lipoprotein component of BamABCDE complex)|nr:outer membrane protein assembly factor BamE [Deltaproteobacteria bacterium]
MKTKIKPITVLFIFILCITFATCSLSDDEPGKDDINNMKQRIMELENRIKDLEQIIRIYHDPKDQEKEIAYGWLNKKNWRSLKKGMTSEEVKKLLGEPVKSVDGSRLIWYYPNFYQSYVSFDENGNLTGWKEP